MTRRSLLGVIFLCVLAFSPVMLAAQDAGSDAPNRAGSTGFELLQNYPNPFTQSTRIPFILGPALFEQGQPVMVSMRIFNVLQQLVGHPTALDHPDGSDLPVQAMEYPGPGSHEAVWDGHDVNGRQVPAGIYYLQINVNGRRQIMKMILSR